MWHDHRSGQPALGHRPDAVFYPPRHTGMLLSVVIFRENAQSLERDCRYQRLPALVLNLLRTDRFHPAPRLRPGLGVFQTGHQRRMVRKNAKATDHRHKLVLNTADYPPLRRTGNLGTRSKVALEDRLVIIAAGSSLLYTGLQHSPSCGLTAK